MNLSENEKRDIIKYIESGKPLPEKYRFLLFNDCREVELLWNGKIDEVENVVLPFQIIEHIDEPRDESKIKIQNSLFDLSGRQIQGWTNKLIWGDNKLILSSLKNGPLRKQIEKEGGLKLIYIDPPFDVGADFSFNIEIGDESFTKKPSIIEEIAYRDTWGKGADSFISMIYERLKLMHDLLADDGSIYVHCDWRMNSYMRLILDEIFGKYNFKNEIIWQRTGAHNDSGVYGRNYDSILFYVKTSDYIWEDVNEDYSNDHLEKYFKKDERGEWYRLNNPTGPGYQDHSRDFGNGKMKPPKGRHWSVSQDQIEEWKNKKLIVFTSSGYPFVKKYIHEMSGKPLQSIWGDCIPPRSSKELLGYPTQKPEKLLERIIKASSNEGDLVADFFCGSGTTLAVAEKLGRKWIGSDLGRFSIHTTRKRMINIQRESKKEGKDFRAFEILNIGKYERDYFVNINRNLREEEKKKQKENKEREFIKLILDAYKSEIINSFNNFVGKKRDRLVAVGPLDVPVTNDFIANIINECKEKEITKVDVLGFDYEMGLDFEEAKKQGIDIQFKVIPREVFDKRAVEKGQVKFYDIAYIEVNPIIKGKGNIKELSIELTDFSVFYNQDINGEVEEKLKNGGSKVVVENGNVVKISKDKAGIVEKEVLTKNWTDWIDYWSIDFDFESKKEIIKTINEETEEMEEKWTGSYIFENEWQSFRTKKDRTLELTSTPKEVSTGRRKIAIKVIDIFGNDTTKVIEINV